MGAAEKLDPHSLLSGEEHEFVRYKRSAVAKEVKTLTAVSNVWGACAVLSQWFIIIGAWYFASSIGQWWAYVIGGLVIGSRQAALPFLMHESVHGLLFTNKTLNYYVCEFFVSLPVNISTAAYRKFHLLHHRHLGTPQDPELAASEWYEDWSKFPKTKLKIATIIIKDLLMLNTPYLIRLTRPVSAVDRMITGKDVSVSERLVLLTFWASLITLLTVTDQWFNFLLLWVIPFSTINSAAFRLRSLAEHHCTDPSKEVSRTRTVKPSWLERVFIAPFHGYYHAEHHLFPFVPCRNLPKLHKICMNDPEYRDSAHITQGYLSFTRGTIHELAGGQREREGA